MAESEAVAEARAAVGRAVQHFFDVKNVESAIHRSQEEPYTGLYVTGWAVCAEYTATEMERAEVSASAPIVPDGQPVSSSLGLFILGAEVFK
ncbi:hypothetical protein SEA_NEPTUNE_10 [Microbacterium phage Neptune]|nr:hypothetical protein SEA_NEPTUNE_10 [Microbacterium phage Neptune]UDL15489.1 hypothetical protein SEA_CYBELE_10 [Microbacterium phage Cybele]